MHDVAGVTSPVFSQERCVFMKNNCIMGLTDNAAFSQSGEADNIRNIVRFHDVTATKERFQEDLLYHLGRIVCRGNQFVQLNLMALEAIAAQDLPLFGSPNLIQ